MVEGRPQHAAVLLMYAKYIFKFTIKQSPSSSVTVEIAFRHAMALNLTRFVSNAGINYCDNFIIIQLLNTQDMGVMLGELLDRRKITLSLHELSNNILSNNPV